MLAIQFSNTPKFHLFQKVIIKPSPEYDCPHEEKGVVYGYVWGRLDRQPGFTYFIYFPEPPANSPWLAPGFIGEAHESELRAIE